MSDLPLKSMPVHNVGGQPMQVPYDFYPEFKPQKLGVEFRAKVRDQQTSKMYNLEMYRGSLTVEEPPAQWLDLQMCVAALSRLLTRQVRAIRDADRGDQCRRRVHH